MNALKCLQFVRLTLLAAVVTMLSGCVMNTETGRRQLLLVSGQQEMELGLSSFNELKKQIPISKDAAANAMVQRVGKRISSVVNLPGAQWEFVVFESKEANAFCLPGGKIGIYTGILPIVKDDAGLAAVMGHEVAHATLHHGAERMSQAMATQLLGQTAGTAVNAANPKWVGAFYQLYAPGSQVLYELPNSRLQETEADRRGLIYMAHAGYEPEAAVQFWERFSAYVKQAGGGGTPWFLRTHPLDEDRIKELKKLLPEAKREFRPAAK